MEEEYKDAAIVVTITPSVIGSRWRSNCAVKFSKDGREAVERLKLDLDYDTPKAGGTRWPDILKKWVQSGKPHL